MSRTAREVFEDHLRIGTEGTVEDDIQRNYASTMVILSGDGVRHGHDGLREQAHKLQGELPNCTFHTAPSWSRARSHSSSGPPKPMAPACETAPTPTSSATGRSSPRPSTTPSRTATGSVAA